MDMIRYDNARPLTESDSNAIADTFTIGRGGSDLVCIVLRTTNRAANWSPTIGRWRSFGWTVPLDSITHNPVLFL